MITIDKEKCIGCKQCIKVCPFTVLKIDENGRAENTGKSCIKCMHCVAICPSDAITIDGQKVVQDKVQELSPNCKEQLEILIKQRRSYRRFKKKRVERDKILHWIEVADFAPSAKNQHPTNWIIVENEAVLHKMMKIILEYCEDKQVNLEIPLEYKNGNNPVLGENASVLIGYCYDDAINGASDTAIAITTIELMMQAERVGTCWGGYLMRFINEIPECKKLIGLPEGATVYGTLLFGYPEQADYRYLPARVNKAKVDIV